MFKVARRLGYFRDENPAKDTAIDPTAPEPEHQHAYSLAEVSSILAHLPEPAQTVFAVAAYTGLRIGEIEGLRWQDVHDGAVNVSRCIWNGHVGAPKTRKSGGEVPLIPHLAARLDVHRLRCGNPQSGPVFTTHKMTTTGEKTPLSMNNLLKRVILPALNHCEVCHKPEDDHRKANHEYKRDAQIPQWYGWHACRRGIATNLHAMGVDDVVIQEILRHSDVGTTRRCYIQATSPAVHAAMKKLDENLAADTVADTLRTLTPASSKPM